MHLTPRTLGYSLVLLLTVGCSRSTEYYIEKGSKLSAAGRDTDAILNFRKAIQKNPQAGQAYFRMGLALERQSNFREAYTALQQAARLLPGSEEANIEFADLCLNLYVADRTHPKALYDQASGLADQLIAANAKSFHGLRLKGRVALRDNGVAEIMPVDPADLGRKVWNQEHVEALSLKLKGDVMATSSSLDS